MSTQAKRQFLFGMHPLLLAVLTAIISLLVLFAIGYPLQSLKWNGVNIGDWIAYGVSGIIIASACFFICREYPKSIWYVPIISNVLGILSATIEKSFWMTDLWKPNVGIWVMSVIAGLIGVQAGKKMH
jgi:hypothetical protein